MDNSNTRRFTGFADVYEQARPTLPLYPVHTILRYMETTPKTVVDLGCGTGLSTLVWGPYCVQAIGIEPNPNMLAVAKEKQGGNIRFVQAVANNTGLPAHSADVVICSQSFHWMEPVSTLKEIDRILKPSGVFATVDCDWPPISKWQADKAFITLYAKIAELESTLPALSGRFVRYPKSGHLERMRESGTFRYVREIVFANTERCTSGRFVNLLLSQGSLQAILKTHPELIQPDLDAFAQEIHVIFQKEPFDIDFSYRMRVGVK